MHPRNRYSSICYRSSTKPAVGGLVAAEVRMTVEEYLDLLERTASNVKRVGRAARTIQKETRPARKRTGKAVKGMAAALRKANKMARKKNGSFKKGYDQARVMRMAHKIRRKM